MRTLAQQRFGHESDAERAVRMERGKTHAAAKRAKALDQAFLSTVITARSKDLASVDARLRRAWRHYELTKERRPCST